MNGSDLAAGRIVLKDGGLMFEHQESPSLPGTVDPRRGSMNCSDGRVREGIAIAAVAAVPDKTRVIGSIDKFAEGLDMSSAGAR